MRAGNNFGTKPLALGQRVGGDRFTLVKPLCRGGMGEVWLAQDERLGEPVALKFLPPEVRADPVALDDLRRETARSHRLTHPNIVRIHDLHEEESGLAFIAMEYVDGPTLAGLRLEQPERVLNWEFLKPLVQQLCAALDYAHGERVIHRDLKPANMMVDGKGRVKLADFGIAATVSDSVSRVSGRHMTSGTLPYMSPQQLAGKHPQVADDIYALGATLYELLGSKPPFFTGDITHQVLHEAPEPLGERLAALGIQNEIPPDVAAIVMACLAKDPAQRPQSARAVAEWIGLEVVTKHSVESLSGDVFPSAQAGEAPPDTYDLAAAAPAATSGRKSLWIGGVVFILLALLTAGGWYWTTRETAGKRLAAEPPGAPGALSAEASLPKPADQEVVAPSEPAAETKTLPPANAPPKRILVVTVTKGFRHSSIPTGEAVLRQLAREDGRFTLEPVGDDQAMAVKMSAAALQQYDGAILLNTSGDLPLPDKQAFLNWVASGKAFVGIHAALDTFRGKVPLDPYIQMAGGELKSHGPQTTVECLVQDPGHPACSGLSLRWTVHDEIFLLNGFDRLFDHVLLRLDKEPNTRAPGDFPISWCKSFGQGKVFVTSLGHREDLWETRDYQKHILGGICWALGLDKGGPLPAKAAAPRTSRWIPLFDGKTLSGWTAPDPGDWEVATDGSIVTQGSRSHLFSPKVYTNLEFKGDVKLSAGANGGMFFRAALGKGTVKGYEAQAATGAAGGPQGMTTGSLYGLKPVSQEMAGDETWFSQHVVAVGNRIVIKVNNQIAVDYSDPKRTYSSGHLALQQQIPGRLLMYRNLMVKPLPEDEALAWAEARKDMPDLAE